MTQQTKQHCCERCGHLWVPRTDREPRVCPKCKSPYWNVPKGKLKTKEKTMKMLTVLAAVAALSFATPAKADNLALIPVGAAAGAAVIEVAASGVLTPAVATFLPIVGFTYLTFETDYKPYEALFGKNHVFYEYPPMIKG